MYVMFATMLSKNINTTSSHHFLPSQSFNLKCVHPCETSTVLKTTMMKTVLFLFTFGLLGAHVLAAPTCPANQEWVNCGSTCPPSCSINPDRPCTLQCVIGCQCIEGYVLNDAGYCVLPTNC
ncbi:hypothetical protein ASPBRDRAFT_480797 [Aspergillus brasiliensis CBS 101740]|uniref:TIL domain-containing protein n=1 Tax=Aspergillus brasiliensis (strain CBS 101740 / IMI 381727 / IBT 21946) TaxID=767769 RepID=A0A1L9UUG4_ASPBC|nr:hypothetical protein ASPBRDRAFT_480797 [Aspergillus brasiliensis CBS 101740]